MYWIRTLFLLLLGLSANALVAQLKKPMTNPYADHKIFHFGFSVGMHTQDLLFAHSGKTDSDGQTWFAEIPAIAPGFNVGLLADVALHEYINVRFHPTIYFGSKQVVFRAVETGSELRQDVRSNYLSFPILLKYSSKRFNNLRPYLLAGVSVNVDLSRKVNEALLLRPIWFGVELGVGSNFYLPYFKFCPELKFCLGVTNVLQTNRTDLTDPEMIRYTDALSKITSRLFVLSLNFE